MTRARIKELLARIKDLKITVYGDFCLDIYWILDPRGSEISIETGIPARAVGKQNYYLGGASNIVANLAALDPGEIRTIGAIGKDVFGRELSSKLKKLEVETKWLVVQENDFDTYAFCKPYLGGSEEARIDFGVFNHRHEETDEALLAGLRMAFEQTDVVILNQQIPNSITNENFVAGVNELIRTFPERIVLVDSRQSGDRFKGVFRKASLADAVAWHDSQPDTSDEIGHLEVEEFGKMLYKNHGKPVFLTQGARGMLVFDMDGVSAIPGIQLLNRLDPVGAGDTAVSALACSLAAGATSVEAAKFANFAAAVTVQKLFQTGTATGDEILSMAESPDYLFQPDLAENRHQARYLDSTNIEICCDLNSVRLGEVEHAVFDHDGTISTVRHGWEDVMESVMLATILDVKDEVEESIEERIRQRVREYINRSTGLQTIRQMEVLVELVKEFGIVPDDRILDAYGYKRLYNNNLMQIVAPRLKQIETGEMDRGKFTIAGTIPFLRALSQKGIKLYLASGTDQDDVIAEARVLGYADLFNGGIYGAVDGKECSKKMVIERIIKENDVQDSGLVCFGDGPVEMRECLRQKGIAIGVASDEVQRQGLNENKRERLIKSGAHFIIPDFSHGDALLELLWGERGIS